MVEEIDFVHCRSYLLDLFWNNFIFYLDGGMGVRITIIRRLLHPFFLFVFGLFLFHQLAQSSGFSTVFLRSYFDDVLAIPVLFYLSEVTLQWVFKRMDLFLDLFMQSTGFVLIVMVFEGWMPAISSDYTRDAWDILAYAVGWGIWLWWKSCKKTPKRMVQVEQE